MLKFPFITKLGIFVKVALFWPDPELMTSKTLLGSTPPFDANVRASRPITMFVKDMMLLQTLAICAWPTLSPT